MAEKSEETPTDEPKEKTAATTETETDQDDAQGTI